MRLAFGGFLPPAVVILPVRGIDPGFDDNVRAILRQTYPTYRLLVVVDDPGDPIADRVRAITPESSRVPISVVVAEPADLPGKVNAVRSGLMHLTPTDEIVVFADSDIRPAQDWLRQLVQPLADSTVGVATGFRWYVPPRPTFWSLVRTEWNGVSANVLFDPRRAFAGRGRQGVRAATRLVFRGPLRCHGMEGPPLAGGDRGPRGPVGDGVGPRPHPAIDVGPVAGPRVRREGPTENPAPRFETSARARVKRPVAVIPRDVEDHRSLRHYGCGFTPSVACSERSRSCSWNFASSDRIPLRRSLCRSVRVMERAGGTNAKNRTIKMMAAVRLTWKPCRIISRTITIDGGRKKAVNTPSIRTSGWRAWLCIANTSVSE